MVEDPYENYESPNSIVDPAIFDKYVKKVRRLMESHIYPVSYTHLKMIQKNEDELKIDALTKREMEVLKEMAGGKFNRDIAKEMKISERTVKRCV